ncbi:CBS domain-containing protein [Actinoplanes sp. NPDC049265]|uniref:CBS domain-containing protein n=1 Tax=Actinoplanes sp. NPDC049265 TaxID=3363902 RepID=UPI003711C147
MKRWTVADVMTRDVVSIPPEASYRETVDTLIVGGISAAPVVDADGRVLGVVSEADLLHKIEAADDHEHRRVIRAPHRAATAKAHAATAAELMSSPAITVKPEVSVPAAARQLEHDRVKRLPVVDAGGRLVGIVSRRDLLRVHLRTDQEIRADVVDDVLMRTLWIDPATVAVEVDRGTVTLGGGVDTRTLAGLAVELTAKVAGVVAVVDKLVWDVDDQVVSRSHGYAFGDADRLMRPGRD